MCNTQQIDASHSNRCVVMFCVFYRRNKHACVGTLSTMPVYASRFCSKFEYMDVILSIFIPCEWHVRKFLVIHMNHSEHRIIAHTSLTIVSLSTVVLRRKCVFCVGMIRTVSLCLWLHPRMSASAFASIHYTHTKHLCVCVLVCVYLCSLHSVVWNFMTFSMLQSPYSSSHRRLSNCVCLSNVRAGFVSPMLEYVYGGDVGV